MCPAMLPFVLCSLEGSQVQGQKLHLGITLELLDLLHSPVAEEQGMEGGV